MGVQRKLSLLVLPEFMAKATNLPKAVKLALVKSLYLLSADVRHPSLQTKKISGARHDLYECRVDHSTRLIYDIKEDALRCWYVGEHDAALAFGQSMGRSGVGLIVEDIEVCDLPPELVHCLRYLQGSLEGPVGPWVDGSSLDFA